MLVFIHDTNIETSDNILDRINSLLLTKKEFSKISDSTDQNGVIHITYVINDNIDMPGAEKISLILEIAVKNKRIISHVKISTSPDSRDITELHLKWYVKNLLLEILTNDRNKKKQIYTVRNYARYFNASSIKADIHVNTGIKTIIHTSKGNFPDREEGLTEHIIIYDSSIEAIDYTQARSIAYNNSLDLNSYIALLLDVGFEMVYSDNRIFIENENGSFNPRRKRTGFYDIETKLKVIDNMNGLFLTDTIPPPTNILSMIDENSEVPTVKDMFFFRPPNLKDIEEAFSKIQIKKPNSVDLSQNKFKSNKHISNEEILFPSITKSYFNSIRKTDTEKRKAFTACARIYNLALSVERLSVTAGAAYLVCAIECLANFNKISFSKFLIYYAPKDFDKNLTDFFYGKIRSGHFHAGNFLFGEFSISLAPEVNLLFRDIMNMYLKFYRIIREVLLNWILKELIILE